MDKVQWFQIAQGVAAVVTVLMAVAIGPLFKLLHKIKTNDLHHLDTKIDAYHASISQRLDSVADQLDEVKEKLDRHLEAHAEGRFS